MTDHRVTDLSYGHLGESTYDVDTAKWDFSIDSQRVSSLQQLLPLTEIQAPSIRTLPENKDYNLPRAQKKWLLKSVPETFPANDIAASLCRDPSARQLKSAATVGQLLALGGAINVGSRSGFRAEPIIAIPCGEVGEVLRILKPRVEYHGWGGTSSAARVTLMNGEASESGHWASSGGTIRQIVSVEDCSVSGTWLAVRQATVTTIFRPMYRKRPVTANIPVEYGISFPASCLDPNPVTALTVQRTGYKPHADVCFNQFYPRQFAVVDDSGSWSIWDIEGRVVTRSKLNLLPGKAGKIYDGFKQHPLLKDPDSADGWHRILWMSNVSTIIVCNRRHLAVFDLSTAPSPTRLKSVELLAPVSTDWILDIKRSPDNQQHLFVLTSSRIYWVEVTEAGSVMQPEKSGSRIIMSYRHFRDVNDETMRLAVSKNSDISVVISSSKSLLFDYYKFFTSSDDTPVPMGLHGSQILQVEDKGCGPFEIQTLQFLDSPLSANQTKLSAASIVGPELQYLERDVKFAQAWIITTNLGLTSTLSATLGSDKHDNHLATLAVTAPTLNAVASRRRFVDQGMDDGFVVADGVGDEEMKSQFSHFVEANKVIQKIKDDLRRTLNWTDIFEQAFGKQAIETLATEAFERTSDLLETVRGCVRKADEEDTLPMTSLFEILQSNVFSGDLESATVSIQEFLETLSLDRDSDHPSSLILSSLALCSGIDIQATSTLPELLGVYDQIGDQWMATLPSEASHITRLARFKVARRVAKEVTMSSIGVSLQKKESILRDHALLTADILPSSESNSRDWDEDSRSESPAYVRRFASQDPVSTLPTPDPTLSVYSQSSAASSNDDGPEDPVLTRLRQYVGPTDSFSKLGASKRVLAEWPSTQGASPFEFDWQAVQEAARAGESGDEADSKKKKEEARRKRRTEKFLKRTKAEASQVTSQPVGAAPFATQQDFGRHVASSQPYAASSQIVQDVPMTQPVGGAFGSRLKVDKKRQKKKSRAAGF